MADLVARWVVGVEREATPNRTDRGQSAWLALNSNPIREKLSVHAP
jgi:hypothetical protein